MTIFLDENSINKSLVAILTKGGHTVVCPGDVGLTGASDARVLERAIREGWIVLTSDFDDFQDLDRLIHTAGGSHAGILVTCYENDTTRDMRPGQIDSAVTKLEKSGAAFANSFVILNHWR